MKKLIMICAALLLLLNACKRDEYYIDGGRANPDYQGNMLQYLQAKKVPFDTVAQIVKLAGMEKQFSSEDFTFFAFDDDVVRRTIGTLKTGGLNTYLFYAGKDTVKTLDQIPPAIWKKYLQRYMFKGVNRLKDYPQIDLGLRSIYPGALYYDYNNSVANIGVNFSDANGVKYIGYRQLMFSYIPDISKPNDSWITVPIASSDIKPTNGVVHSLSYTGAYLGFSQSEFWNDIFISGLLPGGSK
ncbi:hypothetical protein [Pedobacter jeongneungensis]|uniref:hypothetical protein n=1 Tax=Pedobacter jeongneungensis TaxID=947309 RepID=UPI000468D4C1|nr:hypothetical protein [Pedobacter jeongneungensis]